MPRKKWSFTSAIFTYRTQVVLGGLAAPAVRLRRRGGIDPHDGDGSGLTDVDDAGRLLVAPGQGVLETEPVRRVVAVDGLGRRQLLGVGLHGLLGRGLLVLLLLQLRVGRLDAVDDEADVGAVELPLVRLLGIGPARVAGSAEQIQLVAGLHPDLLGEQVGHLGAQLLVELGRVIFPDGVVELRQRREERLVAGRAEVLTEHAVPPRGGEVGSAAAAVGAVALVLVAQLVELAQRVLVLVQRPVRAPVHVDRLAGAGVGQRRREPITDLLLVGVEDGAVVDDEVPRVARNVLGDLVGALRAVLVRPRHLLDLCAAPILAVADDEATHGSRVGNGVRRARRCVHGHDDRDHHDERTHLELLPVLHCDPFLGARGLAAG